jgi:hypothetical protein
MTEHASAKQCKALLAHLAKLAKVPTSSPFSQKTYRYKHGFFHIEVAYGRPRLTFVYPGTGEDDISPRLPAGQMMMWLRAFGVPGLKAAWKERKGRKW